MASDNSSSSSSSSSSWTWKEVLLTDWNIRSFIDWITLIVLGLILYGVAAAKTLVNEYEFCIPAWTLNNDGSYKCGDIKNAAWTYPHVDWSISSFDSLMIGMSPFFFLILFNIIYFNVSYFRNTLPLDDKDNSINIPSNLYINTNVFRWIDATLRSMLLCSVITTILGQILKFVTGLPRPNAYTLLEEDFRTGSVYVSFPSGHVAIGYTNCFLFGLHCQNAIKYSLKRHMTFETLKKNKDSNKEKIEEELRKFNGHYWYLLPIWDKLHYFHTICICAVWSPLVFGASYIGVTRIREYWHSDTDVVAGCIIGVACSYYFGYLRYYNEIYGILTPNININNDDNDANNINNDNSGFSTVVTTTATATSTGTTSRIADSKSVLEEEQDGLLNNTKQENLVTEDTEDREREPKEVQSKKSVELASQ